MEDVLSVYELPYDEKRPVVCMDEMNRQLIKETRVPAIPGETEKVDSVYERAGVADVFLAFEPLSAKRITVTTEARTAIEFADFLMALFLIYHDVDKIILILDNLNTHTLSSLYKAYRPELAFKIMQKFEVHYTPKHGSWLNMAEIELGVLSRQALAKPFADFDSFKKQVTAWNVRRDSEGGTVNWQFTNKDARIKLKKLYPVL